MREVKPTQKPVPSSDIKDLFFNSGLLDIWATSLERKYIDRFGNCHLTSAGMEWIFNELVTKFKIEFEQALLAAGYAPAGTFQEGAEVVNRNSTVLWKLPDGDGDYYRWDGDLPKQVPAGSTPQSTGGIGKGAWVSVGDASLRGDIEKYKYVEGATSIYFIPSVVISETIDNRNAIYAHGGNVFIPDGVSIRCNLLPDDDVTIFKGEGKILTSDPWGNEHIFDIRLAENGSQTMPQSLIHDAALHKKRITLGIIGDSITDGVNTDGWTGQPLGADGNLNSTNYNHNLEGGKNAWFNTFIKTMRLATHGRSAFYNDTDLFYGINTAAAGQRLINGWAYKNFDYGFFQNQAAENTAPDILYIAMGENDIYSLPNMESYKKEWNKIIRKAWGYGSLVCLVSVTTINTGRNHLEGEFKKFVQQFYPSVQLIELNECVSDGYTNIGMGMTAVDAFYRKGWGRFDKTHPAQLLHNYMGAYAARETLPESFIKAKENSRFLGIDESKTYVEESDGTRREVVMENIAATGIANTDAVMGIIKGWTYSQVSNPCYIRYLVWSDRDENVDLSMLHVRPSDHNSGSSRGYSVAVMHNIYDSNHSGQHVYAASKLSPNTYLTQGGVGFSPISMHYCTLRRGLNIVEIIETDNPRFVQLPALIFSPKLKSLYLGGTDRPEAIRSTELKNADLLLGFEKDPVKTQYDMSNICAQSPCIYLGRTGHMTQGVTFTANSVNGLTVGFGVKHTESGLYVDFSSTQDSLNIFVSLIDSGGNTVNSVSKSLTAEYVAKIASGGKVKLICRHNDITIYINDEDVFFSESLNIYGGVIAFKKTNSQSADLSLKIHEKFLHIFANPTV
ncbi:TPA: hypothetical protein RG718_000475 [Providencia rettgeri]|nr:hypothetical protein [Providencia rettgeri]